MEYSRKELIKICEDAVVHHTKWEDRDSYIAQVMLKCIHKALVSRKSYRIKDDSDDQTIWIEFMSSKDFEVLKSGEELKISSRDDYFRDCDPDYETEMFDAQPTDFTYPNNLGYLPTRKRLDEVGAGNDWY